jgi:hypothetical protein
MQMSVHDAQLVETLTGALLAELGYDLAFRKIPRPVRDEAKGYLKRWARKVERHSGRQLPQ